MRLPNQPFAAVALAALLVSAGCLGIGDAAQNVSPTDTGSATAPDRTVSVAATGEAAAAPDRAVLHLSVQASAESAGDARSRVAENVSALRSALIDAGVDETDITTERYNLREVRSRNKAGEPGLTEYRAVHALTVETGDVDRVGTLVETAVRNGATDLRGVEFTLSEQTESTLREEALNAAMDNAREDADVLATNADLEIGGVRSVSTGDVHVRPYRTEAALAASGAGAATTDVESGPVTVTARVQVTYDASG